MLDRKPVRFEDAMGAAHRKSRSPGMPVAPVGFRIRFEAKRRCSHSGKKTVQYWGRPYGCHTGVRMNCGGGGKWRSVYMSRGGQAVAGGPERGGPLGRAHRASCTMSFSVRQGDFHVGTEQGSDRRYGVREGCGKDTRGHRCLGFPLAVARCGGYPARKGGFP